MPSPFHPLTAVLQRLRAKPGIAQSDTLTSLPRVLLVDDSAVNQQSAAEQLALLGIKPRIADTGQLAVQMSRDMNFELILMNLEMRAMDGFETAKQIRRLEASLPGRVHVPMVAYSSSKWLLEVGALGRDIFDGILKKPCEANALKACLLHHCSRISNR